MNQILASSIMMLNYLKEDVTPSNDYLEKSSEYIHLAIKEIRKLSHQLAPTTFVQKSMQDAFQDLLNDINLDEKFNINLVFDEYDYSTVSIDIKLAFFRIFQEQISNILKYAEATLIEIKVIVQKENISMRIIDNGKGFETDAVKKGLGLGNMRRRTELYNGIFDLTSSLETGTLLSIRIPLT